MCADSRHVERIDLVAMTSGDPVAREEYTDATFNVIKVPDEAYDTLVRPVRD